MNTVEKIEKLTKAIAATSNEADAPQLLIERGHLYDLNGDSVSAVQDYLNALDIATSMSDIVHIKTMIALALAKKEGQKEQALFWAISAVNSDPCNAEGYHTLGIVCDVCGFLSVGIESLRRAISLEPRRWESMRMLGSLLRENGQVEEAVETLSRCIEVSPNDPLGLYELAWSLHVSLNSRPSLNKAKELYEKALQSGPSEDLRLTIERKLKDVCLSVREP